MKLTLSDIEDKYWNNAGKEFFTGWKKEYESLQIPTREHTPWLQQLSKIKRITPRK
jgi:hypothetical protein